MTQNNTFSHIQTSF